MTENVYFVIKNYSNDKIIHNLRALVRENLNKNILRGTGTFRVRKSSKLPAA